MSSQWIYNLFRICLLWLVYLVITWLFFHIMAYCANFENPIHHWYLCCPILAFILSVIDVFRQTQLGMVAHTCDFSTWEIEAGALEIWGQSRQLWRHCLKRKWKKNLNDIPELYIILSQTVPDCIFSFFRTYPVIVHCPFVKVPSLIPKCFSGIAIKQTLRLW